MPEKLAAAIDGLSDEVHELRTQVAGERADRVEGQRRERRRMIAMFVIGLVVTILAVGSLAGWHQYSDNVRDHKLCALVNIAADPDPPPTLDRGRQAQQAAAQLAREFHCVA